MNKEKGTEREKLYSQRKSHEGQRTGKEWTLGVQHTLGLLWVISLAGAFSVTDVDSLPVPLHTSPVSKCDKRS